MLLEDKEKKLYFDPESSYYDMSLEWQYLLYIHDMNPTNGLSKNGISKMEELEIKFYNDCMKVIFPFNKEDFQDYFMIIYDQLNYSDNVIRCSKNNIENYLISAKKMAKFQNKFDKETEKLFEDALDYLENYKVKIFSFVSKSVKMYLPNAWYITPYNHLYNTMGPDGHKEANLIYPFEYSIIRDDQIQNPTIYLKDIRFIMKEGWININAFSTYTNLIYSFSTIYPEQYYELDDMKKIIYNFLHKRTYNPRIVQLIVGIESAHAGLFNFFWNLKKNSSNYYEDLEFLKQFSLDDVLVRCCGFHKISSICEKTITTSCINYDEQFREYIDKGWKIDFVKPIVLNDSTRRLEEYDDYFLTVRKILKKSRL